MKALKIWSFVVLFSGIAAYLYGVFSGVFNQTAFLGYILYGTSPRAHGLTLTSLFCLLLSVSLFLVLHALKTEASK